MTECPGVLLPDTTSLRDSLGARVRVYCQTCCRDWWHDLPFVPVAHLSRPRSQRMTHSDARTCRQCSKPIEPGRINLAVLCLACSAPAEYARSRRGLTGCQWCAKARDGRCAKHGGLSTAERKKLAAREWARRKARERRLALGLATQPVG